MDSYIPPPQRPYVMSVAKVVPTPKNSSVLHLPPGWRVFDVMTGYFDPTTRKDSKKRTKTYTMRWFLESGARFGNWKVPPVNSVVQLSGKLQGRITDDTKMAKGELGILGCTVSTMETLSWGGGGSGSVAGNAGLQTLSSPTEAHSGGSVYNLKRPSTGEGSPTPSKQSSGKRMYHHQSSQGMYLLLYSLRNLYVSCELRQVNLRTVGVFIPQHQVLSKHPKMPSRPRSLVKL